MQLGIPIILALAFSCGAQTRWWMDEPIRLIQTNLRESDAGLDTARLSKQLTEFRANTLLFGMGGIAAYYPTRVRFHFPSPYLPAGRDLFGDMLKEAHRCGIRVIGRFDLSKTPKAVYDSHPEWFFRKTNGEPVTYNGLYSTCINGGYYRVQAMEILAEALERYEVDGLFFNMFGNQSTDYSGNTVGLCHCGACETKFHARYGRAVPATADNDYRQFMAESSREVAAGIGKLIHDKRPNAAFLTYIREHVDVIMSESNTAVSRPLPLWPYSASDNVNRARNSEPGKMAINLAMSFVDFPWRFAAVPPAEIRLRLYENMANGGALALNMHGTMDQEDRTALIAARPVFEWHARHEDLYASQESAARVLLLGSGNQSAYRGLFRLLSEQHIPFAVSDNLEWLDRAPRAYDLVLSPDGAPARLEQWVRDGGRLIVCGASPGLRDAPKVVRKWERMRGYFRIQDRKLFPSLRDTNLVFLDGTYYEFEGSGPPALTLIPPAQFGPPEKVWADKVETTKPGLWIADYGKGRAAWFPWDVPGLYYRHSSPGHAGLLADVMDGLLPAGRQLRTTAHPLVEMTLMRQPKRGRTLLHLINHTGHSDTAYFGALELRGIEIEVAGSFRTARSTALERPLGVTATGGYTRFLLPRLGEYEVVELR